MRTTLTLDEELFVLLKRRARERGVSFKEVVNDAIRTGLSQRRVPARAYKLTPSKLRIRSDVDLDKALARAADQEDTELARKLEQGR